MVSRKSNKSRSKNKDKTKSKTKDKKDNKKDKSNTTSLEETFFPSCKICLDTSDEVLLTPCKCKGTSAYVHSTCLYSWYSLEPTKGLVCSVCLHPLALLYKYKIETIPQFTNKELLYIYKPYMNVMISHIVFVYTYNILSSNGDSSYKTFQKLYCEYQALLHILYILLLYRKIIVHNKLLYIKKWLVLPRISFLIVHIFLLMLVPYLYIFAGIIENFFMFLYISEHTRIIEEINSENDFTFTNLIS